METSKCIKKELSIRVKPLTLSVLIASGTLLLLHIFDQDPVAEASNRAQIECEGVEEIDAPFAEALHKSVDRATKEESEGLIIETEAMEIMGNVIQMCRSLKDTAEWEARYEENTK